MSLSVNFATSMLNGDLIPLGIQNKPFYQTPMPEFQPKKAGQKSGAVGDTPVRLYNQQLDYLPNFEPPASHLEIDLGREIANQKAVGEMYEYAIRRQERALNKPDGVASIADQFFQAQATERRARELERLTEKGLEEFAKKSRETEAGHTTADATPSNRRAMKEVIGASVVDPFAGDVMIPMAQPSFSGSAGRKVGGEVRAFDDFLPGTGRGISRVGGVGTDEITDAFFGGDPALSDYVERRTLASDPRALSVAPGEGYDIPVLEPDMELTSSKIPDKRSRTYYSQILAEQGVPLQEYSKLNINELIKLVESKHKTALSEKERTITELRRQRKSEKKQLKRVGALNVSDLQAVREAVEAEF